MSNLKWIILIFVIAYTPIFYNLTKPAIHIWDEAIYANNAIEMSWNHDFITLKNNGEPNLYNTKPPLVIWLQCLCIWVFGGNEFSIRLPSALAALLTCYAIFFFAKKHLNEWIGIIAILFLITTQGYIRVHVSRSGDLDCVLIFFITSYTLLFWDYLICGEGKEKKYFVLIGLLVFLAFMSKSVAGLMPLLGLFFGSIVINKLKKILTSKDFYFFGLMSLSMCAGYYLLRENQHSGYLKKVIFSEYSRFTQNIMPYHDHPFWFFLQNMQERFYKPYIYLIPLIALNFFSKNKNIKIVSTLGVVFCVSYFCLISFPEVKLDWYDAPLYPVFSLLLGCLVNETISKFKIPERRQPYFFWAKVFVIFSFPYHEIYLQNCDSLPVHPQEEDGFAVRELTRKYPWIKNYKVLQTGLPIEHIDATNFYVKIYNKELNKQIAILRNYDLIQSEDLILCSQEENLAKMKKDFNVEELNTVYKSKLWKVHKLN